MRENRCRRYYWREQTDFVAPSSRTLFHVTFVLVEFSIKCLHTMTANISSYEWHSRLLSTLAENEKLVDANWVECMGCVPRRLSLCVLLSDPHSAPQSLSGEHIRAHVRYAVCMCQAHFQLYQSHGIVYKSHIKHENHHNTQYILTRTMARAKNKWPNYRAQTKNHLHSCGANKFNGIATFSSLWVCSTEHTAWLMQSALFLCSTKANTA